jgi:hypothetical protein
MRRTLGWVLRLFLVLAAGCWQVIGYVDARPGWSAMVGSESTSGTGAQMACAPERTMACYTGPAGTEGVGECAGGIATCKPDGSGYGDCVGETTPAPADDCSKKVDADCDGTTCGDAVWSYDFQGPNKQYINGLAADPSGNIYLAGELGGSITFGTQTVVSAGGYDALIAKLDPNGGYLWGTSFGDAANNQGATAVAVDSAGSVVLVGSFFGSMTIGGKTLKASTTDTAIFVAKFDPTGMPLWAFSYGDSTMNQQQALGVAVDKAGDIVVTGWFTGAIDFGKGTMTAAGLQDLFVAKFLGYTGEAVWSHSTGATGLTSAGNGVAVDSGGNAVVVGTSSGAFVQRLDAMGNQSWSTSFFDNYSVGTGVAVDGAGNAYVTGTGKTVATKGPTFVAKLDVLGNQKWAVGAEAAAPFAIAADTSGNTFVAGSLDTTADFGGGALTGPAFLWKLNPDGTHAWSRVYGTGTGTNLSAPQACRAVAAVSPSIVVVGCENYYTMDFGASTGPVMSSPPAGGFNSLNVTLAKIAAK